MGKIEPAVSDLQSSKVQVPGVCRGGGGGLKWGVLKFRVDRRISEASTHRVLPFSYTDVIFP